MSTKTKEQAEELWDKYSVLLDSDIDNLSYYANREMMTEKSFKEAMEAYAQQQCGLRWVNTKNDKPKFPKMNQPIKVDGVYDFGWYDEEKGIWMTDNDGTFNPYDFDVEWLAESPTCLCDKYREALEAILKMKREPGEMNDTYVYNRCWHIADKALNP